MTKLQISLTDQEEGLLAQRAAVLGYDVTRYVKYMIAREAMDGFYAGIPTIKATPRMEKIIKKGIEEYQDGKTTVWIPGKYGNS